MEQRKKKYEKPGIVFQDYTTGRLTGTPEMVERILRECEKMSKEQEYTACPFEDMMPCAVQQSM